MEGTLLRYKQLKKKVKLCTPADGEDHQEAVDAFFKALADEMVRVNRCGAVIW